MFPTEKRGKHKENVLEKKKKKKKKKQKEERRESIR